MAEFNPEVGSVNPDFTGASRGQIADRSLGTLFSGAGDIVEKAAKGADEFLQRNIKEDVYEEVDAINEEFGVADAAKFQSDIDSPGPTPQGLQRAGENLERLSKGFQAGAVKESHFYGRLESMVRQMRQKYPGYRDQIDSMVQSITGVKPANALRKSLMSEWESLASEADAASKRRENFIDSLSKTGDLPPGYEETPQSFTLHELRVYANERRRMRADMEAEKSALALEASRGNLQKDRAVRVLNNGASTLAVSTLTASGKFDELVKILQSGSIGPQSSPQQKEDVRAMFNQLKLQVGAEFDKFANEPFAEGETFASLGVGPDDIAKARELALTTVSNFEESLFSEHSGSMSATANWIKAVKENGTAFLLSNPDMAFYNTLKENLGVDQLNFWFAMSGKAMSQYLDTVDQTFVQFKNAGFAAGRSTMNSVMSKIEEDGRIDEVEERRLEGLIDSIQTSLENLDSPDLKVSDTVQYVRSIFGPENQEVYQKFTDQESKLNFFMALTGPDVSANLKKIRDAGYQKEYNMYKQWMLNTWQGINRSLFQTAQNIHVKPTGIKLVWNPEELQFDTETIVPSGGSPYLSDPTQANAIARRYEEVIEDLNLSLGSLAPIIETDKDKKDLASLFQQMGLDLSAADEETPFVAVLESIGDWLTGQLEKASQKPGEGEQRPPFVTQETR